MWAVASAAGILLSAVMGVADQASSTDPMTLLLGGAGLVGLCGLVWKLVVDYRATSELIDDYREALEAERAENRRLRDERAGRPPTPDDPTP